MKLIIGNIKYECAKAVKGKDFVKIYNESNNIIANFSGIKNFTGYEITGGVWSEVPKTIEQLLLEQIVNLQVEISKIKMGVK